MEKNLKLALVRVLLILLFISCNTVNIWAQEQTSSSEKKKPAGEATPQRKTSSSRELTDDPDLTKSTFDTQPVIDEVKAQLATLSSKLMMELTEFCKKNSIEGEFGVDITIERKGKILTVFFVSANVDDISKKNLLKNKLVTLHFENINIPKKEKVKSRYTLKF